MLPAPFPRLLTILSLLILVVLAADTFILPPLHLREVYDRGYSVDYLASRHYYEPANYILTRSGDKFRVPDVYADRNLNLAENDTFFLDKSRLFHQPVKLHYPTANGFARLPLGFLNSGWYGPLVSLFILFVAVARKVQFIPRNKMDGLILFSAIGAIFLAINYFYH